MLMTSVVGGCGRWIGGLLSGLCNVVSEPVVLLYTPLWCNADDDNLRLVNVIS